MRYLRSSSHIRRGVIHEDRHPADEVLSRLPEARVYFVAKVVEPILTDTGMLTLLPELQLNEMTQPDILLIPGALEGFRVAMEDAETLEWVRSVHQTTRWTTSVCSGALILAAAGVLNGLEATTHWAALPMLGLYGAKATAKRVVRQGKVITAAGVSAGIDMALELAAEVTGRETAESIQLIIEYDPQPPFDAGAPHKASPAVLRQAKRQMLKGT